MTETNKPVAEWNTTDFRDYLEYEHKRLLGVSYRPYKNWAQELALIGRRVGTKKKPGDSTPEFTKAFIDECFRTYKPTKEFPGISFSFMWQFRANVWQRMEAEWQRKAEREASVVTSDNNDNDLEGWF